jgi:cell division protein FtsI (penicillin-binding protein 3)
MSVAAPGHTRRRLAGSAPTSQAGPLPRRSLAKSGPRPPRRPPVRPVRRPAGASPRRRLIALLVVMIVAATVVAGRLTQVQGLSSERYAAVGLSQRLRKIDLPADRGAIFDRNGRDLALSVPRWTITANPRLVNDPLAEAQALGPILNMDETALRDLLSQDRAFVYLDRRVGDDVYDQVKALGLPGLDYVQEPTRVLPGGDLASPVLGMVGTDNEGLSGLEVQFDKVLTGKPGWRVQEKDPSGTPIAGGDRGQVAPVQGDDLVLTLDRSLQYETERSLSAEITSAHAKGGMAIVMQTKTGEVLSMANLVTSPDGAVGPAPKNMTLNNVYEPGSVNKLITISGALEEHAIKPADQLLVPSTIKVGDHLFHEHDPHPTQEWSITDIVANSSNVGSIMIGAKLGKDKLDHYMRAFGFGKKTGLGFPGESAGLLLDPSKYSGTSMGTIPIGQGIAVTALQMLAAYNTIANGGLYVAPKLVKATVDGDGQQHATPDSATRRVVSATTAKQMTAMLAEVVRVGTATLAHIDGYTVAGKTGTARKPLEGRRGYQAGAYMSSFAGFVPAERPELTAIVILDEPTPIYGGLVSAPVFAQVAQYGLREFRIPPPDVPLAPVPPTTPADAKGVGEVGDVGSPATTIPPNPPTNP